MFYFLEILMVSVCLLYFQLETFTNVYKKLTGKDVTFEFPEFVL